MVQNVTLVRSPVDIQCSAGTRCPHRATGDISSTQSGRASELIASLCIRKAVFTY